MLCIQCTTDSVFYVPSCSMFPGPYVPRALSSQGTMFPRDVCFPMFYVPSCSMFLVFYVPSCPIFPRVLCSLVFYVPSCYMFDRVLCSIVGYVPSCPIVPHNISQYMDISQYRDLVSRAWYASTIFRREA